MSKQSPFYKTGISRSPLNTHKPGHSPEMIKAKAPIDPDRTQVKYEKPGMHEATQNVQNKQDKRTQILIDRKIKKANKKSTRKQKQEIRQEARNQRKSIRKNNTIL